MKTEGTSRDVLGHDEELAWWGRRPLARVGRERKEVLTVPGQLRLRGEGGTSYGK